MELIKKNIRSNYTAARGNFEAGVDADIIVPDIKPDILKILQTDAFASILKTEVSDGRVLVYGRIFFTILYSPDREDEKIKSIDYSCDFQTEIRDNHILSDMSAFISPDVGKIDFQILNSRKIRVKASVSLFYEICEQASFDIASCIDGDENPEMCISPSSFTSVFKIADSDFTIRESIELPPGHSAIDELLKTDISISDIDYKCTSGKVVVKGSLNVNYMYSDTLANISCCDYELPFTEIFDIPDADEETICELDFYIQNLDSCPSEDSDGDIRIIFLTAQICARIKASKKEDAEILVDCFFPGFKTEIEKHTHTIEQSAACGNFQTTLREIIAPDTASPSISAIHNVSAKPEIIKTVVDDNCVYAEGNLYCQILYLSASEDSPICTIRKIISFSYSINTPGSKKGDTCTISAKVTHTGYSLNPAGEAEVRTILSLSANVLDSREIELIDEIELKPLSKSNSNCITIYFVQQGDTLWSIAKKYCVSQQDILNINNLDDSTPISSGMKLLLPN